MKKLSFLLFSLLLVSCSKKSEPQIATLKIESISPLNNGSIKVGTDAQFTWKISASDPYQVVYSGIKIFEITGTQSPENAIRTNKPYFERDSIENFTIVIKPTPVLPGLGLDKKYVWQLTAKQKSKTDTSSISVFTVIP